MGRAMDKAIDIPLALTVTFLLLSGIVLANFNTAYNYVVTGLSSATTQGIMLILLVIALFGLVDHFRK
jgi:hypothetical protein